MRPPIASSLLLLLLVPAVVAAAPQSNASRGQAVFRAQCSTCHTVEPGGPGPAGPNLLGVVGRKAASTHFGYSPALHRWGRIWTPKLLQQYLTNPTGLVPGTTMGVAVSDSGQRADLVAYLKSLDGPKPQSGSGGSGPPH